MQLRLPLATLVVVVIAYMAIFFDLRATDSAECPVEEIHFQLLPITERTLPYLVAEDPGAIHENTLYIACALHAEYANELIPSRLNKELVGLRSIYNALGWLLVIPFLWALMRVIRWVRRG